MYLVILLYMIHGYRSEDADGEIKLSWPVQVSLGSCDETYVYVSCQEPNETYVFTDNQL